MNKTFSFIGAGNMGGAMIQAVCRGVGAENVIICDKSEARVSELSKKTGCKVAKDALEAVAQSHFVMLCVKPKDLAGALRSLFPVLKQEAEKGENKVIISIAAGVTIDSISAVLKEADLSLPVIRLLPNTPVMVSKGLIVMANSENTGAEELSFVKEALAQGGAVEEVAESMIDCATPVFSCSPAFVYMFIEALADGGVMSGVPREMAQRFAAQAVLGSAAMVLETGNHPGQLKDAVCSPGGSTIVGVEELEKHGLRAGVASAVYESYKKTTQLGK